MSGLRFTILGLSITSSWGNGHATTYRALVKALARRGHEVTFLERDKPWYANNRDLPNPPHCRTILYDSLEELRDAHARVVSEADVVIVGSYVPEGVDAGAWAIETATGVTAFYDIDTPVTLAKLAGGDHEYLRPDLIPRYDLYLSFTGGPTLRRIEREYGSPAARALYCSVDPDAYRPRETETRWDLGYLGTHSEDRQPGLDLRLTEPARRWRAGRFVVAGPQYPDSIDWPENVERIDHLPPEKHEGFYNAQRFTLNITRADMRRAGYSPSVRLFEAAACGVPIVSDRWEGLDTIFRPGREILIVDSTEEALDVLRGTSEEERRAVGERARRRVLASHTADRRAEELLEHVKERRGATAAAAASPGAAMSAEARG